jgi:hypothetical protein
MYRNLQLMLCTEAGGGAGRSFWQNPSIHQKKSRTCQIISKLAFDKFIYKKNYADKFCVIFERLLPVWREVGKDSVST